jgi:hypothetical protein
MSSARKSSTDAPYLRKIVGLAIRDAVFRNALLADPEKAIATNRRKLRFGPDKVSTKGFEVLDSFSSTELDTLAKIYKKAHAAGVFLEPLKMF